MSDILAMDCAAGACSAAVSRDGDILASREASMARGHAEALMPMIETVLADAGLDYAELDLLGVTIGPGGFTGVRIALAAARGIALAGGLELIGVNTLETLAHAVPENERAGRAVLGVLDSKRADLYAQVFDSALVPLAPPVAVMPERLGALIPAGGLTIVGDGTARAIAALGDYSITPSTAPPTPSASVLAILAGARWAEASDNGIKLPAPEPLYLRPPDAKIPAGGGRLRP